MKLYFILFSVLLTSFVPFHTLNVAGNDGNTIDFNSFEGKNVLIVNVATNSADSNQFARLEELHQLYQNSLVILAVPSNDFGNEPLSDNDIKDSLVARYNIHYLLAGKAQIKDSVGVSPLYQWLTKKVQNGMTDSQVGNDFYKYLVKANGQIVGIYSNKIQPTDAVIQNALK